MIHEANDEIRSRAAEAVRRRQVEAGTRRPFAYLDWLIVQLEDLHVAGKKRIPKAFEPHLFAVADLLPEGVEPPLIWRTLIRHVIDQVFDLQEQLLQLRDPDRARAMAREDTRPEMPPMFLLPQSQPPSESAVA
ncbi:MAG TPA: hypothetical protein VGD57_04870 [Candidatus Dormibacteraeota bacterium]|jgi:hypothetical protein